MCGICGFINIEDVWQKKMLCHLNINRGRDSVGIVTIGDGRPKRFRMAESISDVLKKGTLPEKEWEKKTLLYHGRAASPSLTSGKAATVDNAHPFKIGNITGAHNGIWRNHEELAKKHKIPEKWTSVDSMVAVWMLNRFGTDGLKELDGIGSMWWLDSTQPNMLFLWTWHKCLAVADKKDGTGMIFSSDVDHLNLVTNSNDYDVVNLNTKEGQLLSYSLETGEYIGRELVEAKDTPANGWQSGVTYYNGRRKDSYQYYRQAKRLDSFPSEEDEAANLCMFLITRDDVYFCPNCSEYISRTEYMDMYGVKVCAKCHSHTVYKRDRGDSEYDIAFLFANFDGLAAKIEKRLDVWKDAKRYVDMDKIKRSVSELEFPGGVNEDYENQLLLEGYAM